jgi:hypothetical protein
MTMIAIDDDLLSKARQEAARAGFPTVDEYVAHLLAREIDEARRRRLRESTAQTRKAMLAAGLTEEEILEDFERFRDELWQERVKNGEVPWLSAESRSTPTS